MRRRQTVRAIFVAAVFVSLGPLLAIDFTLNTYADLRGHSEVEAAAERYAMRAERTFDTTLNLLQTINAKQAPTCLPPVKRELRRTVWSSNIIDFIALVDENGFVMCGEPVAQIEKGAILPPLAPDSPIIEVGIEGEGHGITHKPLVSWTLDNGVRLMARIKEETLDIDAGPDYLRASRQVDVTLDDGSVWYSIGGVRSGETNPVPQQASLSDTSEDRITARIASPKYPLNTVVSVDRSTARSLIRPLRNGAIAAAFGFFILASSIAFIIAIRSDDTDADEIELAIRNKEFVPYYQPVMDIDTGLVQGCEVLARWIKADGTMISPGAFMPYAENSGAIFEITRQLMQKAADEVGDLYRTYPGLKLSINLFAGHFDDRKIVADTEAIIGKSSISYDQLVFEVTERFPLRDLEMARKVIAEFHALGVRVALDDAGTGHGGLAYLQQLGIDIIKIDKMFIDTLASDHAASAIVDTLVELGGNLGMGIVAEGVETTQQIERLRELGVTAAQGYVFAPALAGSVFIELTKRLAPSAPVELDGTEADADSEFDTSEDLEGWGDDDIDADFQGASDDAEGFVVSFDSPDSDEFNDAA